jgi:glycogen synthase kinase 3 beta
VFRDGMDPVAADLVNKLLVYSPSTRLNAHQAIAHPFFDDLRDEGFSKSLKIPIPELLDFSKGNDSNRFVIEFISEELGKNASLIGKLVPKWATRNIKIDLMK